MFKRWFTAKPDPAVEALKAANDALVAAVRELIAASTANVEVLKTIMKSFEISSPPESRVLSDTDEWRLEQERAEAAAAGHPQPDPYKGWIVVSPEDL